MERPGGSLEVCIGFGETEGRCENVPDWPKSRFWCAECNQLRIAALHEQLQKVIATFPKPRTPGGYVIL